MSLSSNVQSRYSANRLVALTNPDDSTQTTIDTTRLNLASTDVESVFKRYTGLTYDDTDPVHVAIAVEGVILTLQKRSSNGTTQSKENYDNWLSDLRQLAQSVGVNQRVTPITTSELTPSTDTRGTQNEVQPDFDNKVFDDIVPEPPAGGSRR